MTTPIHADADLTDRLNKHSSCALCPRLGTGAPAFATDSTQPGALATMQTAQKTRRQLDADFELIGYDTICKMLAVDGKAPSSRTVMRHLRHHRDIVKPVRIGSHVGYPVEQILKFIARLRGKSRRGEMFL